MIYTSGLSANMGAFLEMLKVSEIGAYIIAHSDDGYNILVSSTPENILTFPSYKDHPRIYFPKFNSTAAGSFQINAPTYDDVRDRAGVNDFTPSSQELCAMQILKECGAIGSIESGAIPDAIQKASSRWASLPGSKSGQPQNALQQILGSFTEFGGTLMS